MTPTNRDPFFKPLWRRVAIIVAVVIWAGLELYAENQTWAIIAGLLVIYGVWSLFLTYKTEDDEPKP
jgi:hypothetical protein